MTDRRWMAGVFFVTSILTVIGAVTALAGSQMAWERGVTPGRVVSEDGGAFTFPDRVETYDADDLGSGTSPLAAALLAVSLLPLLTGPRVRPFLYALSAILGGIVAASTRAGAQIDFSGTLQSGPGRTVTMIGAALAMASSLIAIGPSSGVARLRMPERAPEEVA